MTWSFAPASFETRSCLTAPVTGIFNIMFRTGQKITLNYGLPFSQKLNVTLITFKDTFGGFGENLEPVFLKQASMTHLLNSQSQTNITLSESELNEPLTTSAPNECGFPLKASKCFGRLLRYAHAELQVTLPSNR